MTVSYPKKMLEIGVYNVALILTMLDILLCLPPGRVERHIGFPLASVRLSVTKSCPLYNLKTIRDISKKLQTLVKHT